MRSRLAVLAAPMLAGLLAAVPAHGQAQVQGAPPPVAHEQFDRIDNAGRTAPAERFAALARTARADGRVRVIAGLQVSFLPEGALGSGARSAQRAAIGRETAAVRKALSGTAHRVVHTYETVPYIALELAPGALERLRAAGVVASLQEDTPDRPTLTQSTAIVEATEAATLSRTGTGFNVAVLDTGVQKTHPFLQQSAGVSKVVSEACFSDGDCPGGTSTSTVSGSGLPCTYAPDACRHGTHVAGIAAGKGTTFSGVARGAGIVAIQVFSRFDGPADCGAGEDPCALSFDSDQLAGLERVFAIRNTFPIGAVNISIGGGSFSAACNSDSRKAAIDNLRAAGIATVIASGNDSFTNAVNSPGCISTAETVGATSKSDVVTSFSNSGSLVDFFAPGEAINSSVPTGTGPGGTDFDVFDGTSMATPHVAGAFAVARQTDPAASVLTIENALKQSGKPITDAAASPQITRDRIRVLSATADLKHTNFRAPLFFGPLAGLGVASNGVGLGRRTNATPNPTTGAVAGNIAISGIPPGAVLRDAYLFWQVLGGPDTIVTFDGTTRAGTLVGASGSFNCWGATATNNAGANFGGAYRTYRNRLPVSALAPGGNGVYPITNVGGSLTGVHGRPDGQGASLVVIYSVPASSVTGRAVLRYGAMTAQPSLAAMSHTFSGLVVPSATASRELHEGIGDGESFADPAMQLGGAAVTASNFWSGSDGAYWDDKTFSFSAAQLPAGTTSRTNSQAAGGECLTWAYSLLGWTN
jgi:subtilisin family serine protease